MVQSSPRRPVLVGNVSGSTGDRLDGRVSVVPVVEAPSLTISQRLKIHAPGTDEIGCDSRRLVIRGMFHKATACRVGD